MNGQRRGTNSAAGVPRRVAIAAICAGVLPAGACRREAPSLTVGGKASVEDLVLGEIIAQHIEKRLGFAVTRSLDMVSTEAGVQSMLMTSIDVLPEDTTALVAGMLKESINPDPLVALFRTRSELARIGRLQVLEPLGVNRHFVMVTRTEEAQKRKVKTLTDASKSNQPWMLAQLSDFQGRVDGYSALMGTYSIRQEVSPRTMKSDQAYAALAAGQVDMISGCITDGQLALPEFVVLEDDRKAFIEGRTCILVRNDSLDRHKGLKATLDELCSRFSNDAVRQMNAEVTQRKRKPADVGREFLQRSNL